MANLKNCLVCDKQYEYCGNCDKHQKENTWKQKYCSENCRNIFKTCMDYISGVISIDEAKNQFDSYDTDFMPRKNIINTFYKIKLYENVPVIQETVQEEEVSNVIEQEESSNDLYSNESELTSEDTAKELHTEEEAIVESRSRRRRRMRRNESE